MAPMHSEDLIRLSRILKENNPHTAVEGFFEILVFYSK